MSSLKVIFSVHFFLLESLKKNVLQYHLHYSITFCISTCIMNKVTWRYKHHSNSVLMNVSVIYLTYNISVICWNSREAKTCWKCIHLFKLDETFVDCYTKQWLPQFPRYFTFHLLWLIWQYLSFQSVLINQFVSLTLCLHFAFTGLNFQELWRKHE